MSLKPLQDSQGSLPKQLSPAWELLRQRSIAALKRRAAALLYQLSKDCGTHAQLLRSPLRWRTSSQPELREPAAHRRRRRLPHPARVLQLWVADTW